MRPIELNLVGVGLLLMLTSESSCYSQAASQCQRGQHQSENQCKFNDDYSALNRYRVESDSTTSHNVSSVTSDVCRNVSVSQEFVCDSSDLKELPSVDEFPKNLTRFYLNATKIETLKNRSFLGLSIECLLIFDNVQLNNIETEAFVGIDGLKALIIQNNIKLNLGQILHEDFFRPFVTLVELNHLILHGNRINLDGVHSSSSNVGPSGPCLTILDLSKNNLEVIEADFFRAFNCGSIKSLVLANAGLKSIHNDAFRWISGLEMLDLSSNSDLLHTDISLPLSQLKSLSTLRLDSNFIDSMPFQILEIFNGSLRTLNLSLNIFEELSQKDFPEMQKLQTLFLDGCRISQIHEKAFSNLPSLEYLSLRKNFLHEVPALAGRLRQLHFQGFDDDPDTFVVSDHIFVELESLEELSMISLKLENLTYGKLNGLKNLTTLRLEKSRLKGLETEALRAVPRLKRLLMAYCSGLPSIPVETLKGPESLEVLDLSYIQIFPPNHARKDEDEDSINPLAHTKILNLTGSLVNIDKPLEHIWFSKMPQLQILEISQNSIDHWNSSIFRNNTNLRRLVLNKNHDYIQLTSAMIADFQQLDELDLSGNKFDCNSYVIDFYKLVEIEKEDKKRPQVVGWNQGEGYFCKLSNDSNLTFKAYVFGGINQDPGYPLNNKTHLISSSTMTYIYIAVGSVLSACVLGFAGYYTHSRWWYVEYLMARRQIKKNRKRIQSDLYLYDAFVSYSNEDEVWVHSHLLTNLETDEEDQKALHLCMHERDFKVGRPITENIVAALEESRTCILVLTSEYAKSSWCNFEAQVAHHMFQEQGRLNNLIVVLPNSIPAADLNKTLRYILKTRTYIEWKSDSPQFWKRLRATIAAPGFKTLQPSVSVIELIEVDEDHHGGQSNTINAPIKLNF